MSAEEWRPIPGWPYEASSLGRIRRATPGASTLAGRVLKSNGRSHRSKGYHQVRLSRGSRKETKTFCVHQLVALAFLGPLPEGHHTNHRNADKSDNRIENLEYVTALGNVSHARALGLSPSLLRGEDAPSAKLNAAAVRVIRSTPRVRGTVMGLARRYGVGRNTIYAVINGKSWTHVP